MHIIVQAAILKPGGLEARPSPVPKEQRIETANELSEDTYKRVERAIEPNRWEKAASAELRQKVFGERPLPTSRAAWTIEMKTIRGAVVELGDKASASLKALLPRIDEALAALEGSKAQPAGRPKGPVYAAAVLEAAVALDLMLGDLLAWASSQATSQRYGGLARAIHPKRRSDASSEPAKGSGAGAGQPDAKTAEPKSDGAGAASNGATAPHANESAVAQA